MHAPGVRYKAAIFTWIGRTTDSLEVLAGRSDSIKSAADAKRVEVTVASTGAGSPSEGYPRLLNALAGTRFRLISGFASSPQGMLALERGEVDAVQSPWDRSARGHGPDIEIDGTRILIAWDEPMPRVSRPWFTCPACGQRCRYVYLRNLVACRRCSRLDWASRHQHRQMPGVHRVARLRRKLGADPRPFTAIPERPKHHVRYNRIAERIRAEEAGLVGYLDTIVHDLRRRIRVRKAKHQW